MDSTGAETKSGKSSLPLNQSTWRKLGAACILGTIALAVYSVMGSILRDSVLHVAGGMLDENPEISGPIHGVWFCLGYWGLFSLLVLSALYLAMVDIRYIRLRYALERQKLFQEGMNNALGTTESDANESGDD